MKIKKRNYVELFSFVAFVAIGFFLHFCNYDNSVFALSEYEENFFAQNNNLFYEPCETSDDTGDGTIKISGSTAEEKVWSGLTSFLSEEQAAGVMGNLNHESGLNPIRRQGDNTSSDIWSDNASSGWALGLAQWDGTRRPKMLNYVKNKDSSLIELFDASNYKSSADDFIADAGHEKANKLYMYEIEFLKSEIDKSYKEIYNLSDVSEVAMWFCEKVERPASCAESRATKAQEYYDKFAGKTIVGNGVDSAGSGVSSTTLTSSVHDKAWELANQTKEQAMQGPTAAYTAAIKSVGGDTGGGDQYARSGESCDMFVATVLRASGVDTEVPFGAVSAQAEWFASHPEIYTEVEGDASDPNTYQPGDIRIRDGHVEIFGEKDGKAYILSASHPNDDGSGGRWAGYQDFFVESGYEYKIYRTTGQSACVTSNCTQGNMNINATAVCLAWPLGTDESVWEYKNTCGQHKEANHKGCKQTRGEATDAWNNAFDTVYPDHQSWGTCPKVGASCDVGTATVVRYSGVDENFPRGLDGMLKWAKNHSDIWEVLDYSKDSLEPGDVILALNGGYHHVWTYVEDENGVGYRADSGLCSKFYSLRDKLYHGDYILRAKNAKNSTAGVDVENGVNSSTTVSTYSGSGASAINDAGIEIAWPRGTSSSDKKQPTEAFKRVMEETNLTEGETNSCRKKGMSCGLFVGGAVRYAGVDDDFPTMASQISKYVVEHSDQWEEITDGNYQGGDILLQFRDGLNKPANHVAMAVDIDGVLYKAEGSLCDFYGQIGGELGQLGSQWKVYRYKGNSDNCDECAGQEDDNGTGLKEGGMTLEEAKTWMETYRQEASKKKKGSYSFQGASIHDAGCFGGTLNNCVAFSQWFLNKYTSIGPNWGNTVNGEKMVQHLGSTKGLKTGDEPRPYAIFSTGTYNHTGVVLGVTEDSIIVGEASCHGGYTNYWPGVSEWSLETAKSKKMTYAYTDDIINVNGL